MSGRLKRSLLAALAFAAAIAPAHADEYPSRQIELIVPFAAGGGSGLVARMLSDGLAKRYGQAVVVINRPGGNTNIGTVSVVRAKPDGYTLGIASVGMTANPSLYKNLNYDPQTEIEPISLLANSPTVLVVPPSLPVNTLAEFIAYAKARPGELNYASYGAGSGPHMATELFQSLTGVKMVHVPYGGGGPASLGAMTGQVQALFSSVLPVVSMIKAGTLKADRHRRRAAPGIAAGRADVQGERARLPDRHLVRPVRAGENAAGDHRFAAQGDGGDFPRARRARQDRRVRRRGGGELTGRIPGLHQGRDGASRQGRARRRHPAGLSQMRLSSATETAESHA